MPTNHHAQYLGRKCRRCGKQCPNGSKLLKEGLCPICRAYIAQSEAAVRGHLLPERPTYEDVRRARSAHAGLLTPGDVVGSED